MIPYVTITHTRACTHTPLHTHTPAPLEDVGHSINQREEVVGVADDLGDTPGIGHQEETKVLRNLGREGGREGVREKVREGGRDGGWEGVTLIMRCDSPQGLPQQSPTSQRSWRTLA